MPLFKVTTTATATEEYIVEADDREGAKQSIERGRWLQYRDLGNDDTEIIEVEEVA